MSTQFRRGWCGCVLAVCALAAGPAVDAQGSDGSIRATVKDDVPKITRSQARILDGLATLQKTHSATALIKALDAQDRDLEALEARVSRQRPSSPTGAKGKADVTDGLRLIIKSNRELAGALARSGAASKSRLRAAEATGKKGNADLNAGAKLLGV